MANTPTTDGEKLELRYIPLDQVEVWDANPKLHDLDALARSIATHGFGDPPKFDSKLGGLVYGNGRSEALAKMQAAGQPPPRGIGVLESGQWAVPVIFGVDAESRDAAVAFGIDHNNLTLVGGNLGLADILAIWDEEGLQRILADAPGAGELLASLDAAAVSSILDGPDFEPVSAEEQSSLDERKTVTCPECGHDFTPEG